MNLCGAIGRHFIMMTMVINPIASAFDPTKLLCKDLRASTRDSAIYHREYVQLRRKIG